MAQGSPLDTPGAKKTSKAQLKEARKRIEELLSKDGCNPILVRLAWHDSGTYDKSISDFPNRGGANGSIRFFPEIGHGANAGLVDALQLLKGVCDEFSEVGYADLLQLASATGIEVAGGPKIPLRYGRKDADKPEDCAPEGNLPAGEGSPGGEGDPRWPKGAKSAAQHLRDVFYRMGFNDQEIVALSGAHTLGRAKPDRSGLGKEKTKYTESSPEAGKKINPGGSSWTPQWLKFDNSYFTEVLEGKDPELLVLETDNVLFQDEGFKPWALKYAKDEKAFFEDYAKAHVKLSELGSDWVDTPFTLDDC